MGEDEDGTFIDYYPLEKNIRTNQNTTFLQKPIVKAGQKAVLIEDLISTGGSSLKAAEALQQAGVEVLGMAAIFTYGFGIADENFQNAGIPLVTLSNYDVLVEEAIKLDYISDNQLMTLQDWRVNPSTWGV